ncbi:MAG: putative metal-binding motif-containing protein [Anaerolineales bacterium]|nr:putative metal-binding motif-containing protein [Anaerolineales bacterium]
MNPNPSLGPGEYVIEDIPFGEVVLGWGLSSNVEHTLTIAVRALDAAGNELGINRRQIQFQPCALPEDFVENTLYLHGLVEPETVWQCPDDPGASLAYIYAELFDPSGVVSRVTASSRLTAASGANSGSLPALELERSPIRTPAGGWYYYGTLDTHGFDLSRLSDFDYGLWVYLQAFDASGSPVYSVLDPYIIRFRTDCYTDETYNGGTGKQDVATETPEPSGPKTFVLSRNAVCRTGPSLDYKVAEYISAGASVPAQARSANSAWLVVVLPNGVRCWVGVQLGTLDGDPNELPEEKAPDITVPPTKSSGGGGGSAVDADGDGYKSDVDCNDSSDKINPGAPEYPDDYTDSNCNGEDNS